MNHLNLFRILFFGVLLLNCNCVNAQSRDYTSKVNPFIGTVGSGNTFTGPVVPYGMMQLGPYLRYDDVAETGTVYGFSLTHMSGMAGGGNGVKGSILVMPFVEETLKNPATFQSQFSHKNEVAHPGYYKTKLDEYDIKVELTSTTRAGIHKYTFPESTSSGIVFKLGKGELHIDGNEITGVDSRGCISLLNFRRSLEVMI